MGLDIAFHRNQNDILELRNHLEFLNLFEPDIGGRVYDGYDDFYVTDRTIGIAEARLNYELSSAGIGSHEIEREIPEDFWDVDAREADCTYLLRCYPALLAQLRDCVRNHGPVICSYS